MAEQQGVRRAEVLAALSIAIDLGLGLPMEHVLRSSLVARVLADELGLDEDTWGTTYWTNLVLWIGCHADSHEFSRWFGDDLAMRSGSYETDWSGLPYLRYVLSRTGSGRPPLQRSALLLTLMAMPRTRMAALIHSHCLSAGLMADRIGLGSAVAAAVGSSFERWDGTGLPAGRRGTEIPLPTRLVQLSENVEVHLRRHGLGGALRMAQARSGRQFDPDLVAALLRCRDRLQALPDEDAWTASLAIAPDRDLLIAGDDLDVLLGAIGDFADLKCTFTVGHSRAVATLAASAAERLGLPAADVTAVRRAGHVHDLGRMGVPNTVWEKASPLGGSDRERIRLVPYYTGRILRGVRGLERVTALAEAHRERLDGSGYPGGSRAGVLPLAQRVLAAADTYQGWREHRPHRPALDAPAAARALRGEATAGRLDHAAVDAVLEAAGHARTRTARSPAPAGLTAREVEVLGLVAGGRSVAEVADLLVISRKTVRNHLEHVYAKAGVTNRTGAALFALEHGLVVGATAP